MVYVISKDGKILDPTNRHGMVRHLLKQGLARVIQRDPFTIQLLYDTTTYTPQINNNQSIVESMNLNKETIKKIRNNKENEEIENKDNTQEQHDTKEKKTYYKKRRRYRKPRNDNNKTSNENGKIEK